MTEMAFSFLGSPFCSSPSFLVLYLSESEVEMSERKIRKVKLKGNIQRKTDKNQIKPLKAEIKNHNGLFGC